MRRHYKKYFIGNNLISDYKKGIYFDSRGCPEYASALIVPIRARRIEKKKTKPYYNVYGFLCINSKFDNQFPENDPITNIMTEYARALADCLYALFSDANEYISAQC